MLTTLTDHLRSGGGLDPRRIGEALDALTDEALPPEPKADFLTALALKGETIDEIHGFASGLLGRAVPFPVPDEARAAGILDVVGTGGDRAGTINLSTAAALVACAAGVPVAKHGNRAITSRCGSADVLAALGIPTELPPAEAGRVLRERGFVFLLAPRYHPAFRAIAPARRLCAERGQRTLFNLLGPLLNPARPDFQLLGVPAASWCQPFAGVLQRLGLRRGLVVCGEAGRRPDGPALCLDELSPLGVTTVATFSGHAPVSVERLEPASLGLPAMHLADLVGDDAPANAALLRAVFAGADRGARRQAILLNAAGALVAAGRAGSIKEGMALAAELVDSGAVTRKLAELGPR